MSGADQLVLRHGRTRPGLLDDPLRTRAVVLLGACLGGCQPADGAGAMSHHALERTPAAADDAAYSALLGHTMTCTACRSGTSCPTAVRLGRKWRAARR
ncbi:hypothetical protein [Streptomyces sp. NPDC057557]|uniref:hypothetical protein n=1 Tax=Streptomyces sp. NPDC057557 TaxID=3346167 RepID=UPI0036748052